MNSLPDSTHQYKERRCLVNGANLHVGGGVQVAASFINDASKSSKDGDVSIDVIYSSKVRKNLNKGFESGVFEVAFEHNMFGFNIADFKSKRIFDNYDLVFTIFGPLYRFRKKFISIVGFAQPWIIYPNNECYSLLPLKHRILTRIKFWVQAHFFKKADHIVVESDHVKLGLVQHLGISPNKISVVYNCISNIYRDPSSWESMAIPKVDVDLKIGFLGRNYLHKNTIIFPKVAEELRNKYGLNAKFFITFSDDEWSRCGDDFRKSCINLGELSASQCPSFYKEMDVVLFASLLECFSATPLEAMAMEVPLVVSDRQFNRDVCGEHARYFDPLSATDAADQINEWYRNRNIEQSKLPLARQYALNFSSSETRAEEYLKLIERLSQP